MRNADQPCWDVRACNEDGRCLVHADCIYCGDEGYVYKCPPGALQKILNETDWEKYKFPCVCEQHAAQAKGDRT